MTTHKLLWIPRNLGILLALSGAAHAQFIGSPGSPFPAGTHPQAIAVGDFNGDGKADIAVANLVSNDVTVLLGGGIGQFTAASVPVKVGLSPNSVTVGDIDGNGELDLVVANKGDNTITVLIGNGKGQFTPLSSAIAVGAKPYSVALGDFNGDGHADLAVANFGDSTISVLLGNGGGFTPAAGSPFASGPAGAFPSYVTAADFNGDGKLDLAIANFGGGTVAVMLGDGTGAFAPAPGSPFVVGSGPGSIGIGDFDGNGKPDLAVVNGGSDTVTILLGNGTGGFTPTAGPYAVGSGPDSVAVADFDGDGKLDLAVANFSDSTVSVLLGNGTGGFTPAQGTPLAAGTEPAAVAVGDFNRDGKPDLAFAGAFNNDVTVLLDTFAGTPSGPVTVSAASGTAPVAPGSIVSIYGSNLATIGTPATTLPLPTSLGGTSVSITDSSGSKTALPLFYAGPTQINAEIPATVKAGAATLTVTTSTAGAQTGSVTLAAIAPGLFTANQTGKDVAAAQFVTNLPNGTQTTVNIFSCSGGAGTCAGVPLDVTAGASALVLYGTGIQNRASLSDVTVTIGNQNFPAAYAGPAPNYAGEDQVNVLLPASLAGTGNANVTVTVAGVASNIVTIDLQ